MGWCSGSYMAEDIFKRVEKYLPEDVKKEVAQLIYDIFSNEDADCWESDMRIMQYAQE